MFLGVCEGGKEEEGDGRTEVVNVVEGVDVRDADEDGDGGTIHAIPG